MKKQLLKSALIAVAGVGLFAGSAMATSYWQLTDTNTANSQNSIKIDSMGNNGSFGIFYDFDNNNTIAAGEYYQVFNGADTVNTDLWLNFKNTGGVVNVSLSDSDNNTTGWTVFNSTVFGYYFKNDTDSKWIFTDSTKVVDSSLGDMLTSPWYITTSSFGQFSTNWIISLYGGTSQLPQMKIQTDDVSAVPEPTTMLLFGVGITGLATISRRKSRN